MENVKQLELKQIVKMNIINFYDARTEFLAKMII